MFKWEKLLQTHLKREKLVANNQINRRFLLLKQIDPRGLSAPCSVVMYMTIILLPTSKLGSILVLASVCVCCVSVCVCMHVCVLEISSLNPLSSFSG